MASFNAEEFERRRRQIAAQQGFADLANRRREQFGGDGLGGPAPAQTRRTAATNRTPGPGPRSIISLTGYIPLPLVPSQRSPGTRTPSPGRGPSISQIEQGVVQGMMSMDRPVDPVPERPSYGAPQNRQQSSMQLDPVEVRNRQNMLLAQQRGVDQQIRALRRKRVQGGELSPQEIQQLTQLEQQAVQLRQGKVDAFRLGNELQGRGPLSADEAEASRQRLGLQVAEARRRVLGQAEGELDSRFDAQVQREQAGIPDYRPAGMGDRREVQLREEMAGPSPEMAQRQFMEQTAAGNSITGREYTQREARMQTVRQAEMERQARSRRAQGIGSLEQDAALDARETMAQIQNIEAQNQVQAARNRGQAAEVESRGLTLAESEINQRIDEIDGLGSQEISARASELEAIIAENRQRASAATGDTAVEFRRRTQSAEAELAALKAEEDLRVTKDQIDRVRSGMSSGEFSFTTPGERADAAAMWLRAFEGGEDASGNSMPGFVGKSLHGRTGADVVGSMRTLVEILDAVDPLQKPEAAQAISTRLREVYGGGNGWMVLSGGTRRSWRGDRVDSSSVNNWNQVAAQTAKVMEMGGERQPIVYVTHGVNGGTYAIGSNGKSVRVTSGQGLSDQAAKSHREKVYGTSST